MFYWTPAARERDELGSRFGGVPARWRDRDGVLHGAAPVNGHAARSTAARVETVSAKELGSSRAESEAGITAQRSPLSGLLHKLQAFHCKHCTNSTTLSRQRSSQPALLATLRTPAQPNNQDDERPPKNSRPQNSSPPNSPLRMAS